MLKRLIEGVLARAFRGRLERGQRAGRTLVLAYHNVIPDSIGMVGDPSLHVTRRSFSSQLDLLAEYFDVVGLESALDGPGSGDRPRAVITFDDAYYGALAYGVPELTKRGLPATIFVAPYLLNRNVLWWDALAASMPAEAFRRTRDVVLGSLKGDGDGIRRWLEWKGLLRGAPWEHLRTATEDELAVAAKCAGITLGSHTWSHPNLQQVGESELRAELEQSLEWLKARFAAFVPWLAYPYGLQTQAVADRVKAVGYRGAFRVEGGWLPLTAGDPFDLPRLNIPRGLSVDGFALRLCGLFC